MVLLCWATANETLGKHQYLPDFSAWLLVTSDVIWHAIRDDSHY